jgi:hypothetical protein
MLHVHAINHSRTRALRRGRRALAGLGAVMLLLGLHSCGDATSPAKQNGPGFHMLFVGSSLTYWNDIPALVLALSKAAGHDDVTVGSVTIGGTDLRDHWNLGDAARAIQGNAWNVVVLEQGPSARADSRVLLRDYVARFNGVIKAAGANTALYMTWPMQVNLADFPASSQSYKLAASDVGATLYAVGDAWRAAWARDPSLALYDSDGWHPGPNAAYLAALVMVGKQFNQSVVGLPSRLVLESGAFVIPSATAEVLQQAADDVNR